MAWLCCLGVERRGDLELPDGFRAFVVARFYHRIKAQTPTRYNGLQGIVSTGCEWGNPKNEKLSHSHSVCSLYLANTCPLQSLNGALLCNYVQID